MTPTRDAAVAYLVSLHVHQGRLRDLGRRAEARATGANVHDVRGYAMKLGAVFMFAPESVETWQDSALHWAPRLGYYQAVLEAFVTCGNLKRAMALFEEDAFPWYDT